MNKRIEFFADIFNGVGFGFTFGIYDKHLLGLFTFLCFNIYLDVKLN